MVKSGQSSQVAVFALGEVRFALTTEVIEAVIRAVEVSPVADAPAGVIGVINLHGRIVPVLDIRPRFGLAPREIAVSDHFVIARNGERTVAILVDAALDVIPADTSSLRLGMEALTGLGGIERVVMQGEGIVPVQDLSRFLPAAAELRKTAELKLVA
jgi:purine-binding chemotaxis protein CheW